MDHGDHVALASEHSVSDVRARALAAYIARSRAEAPGQSHPRAPVPADAIVSVDFELR
jgi:hypothetical protein